MLLAQVFLVVISFLTSGVCMDSANEMPDSGSFNCIGGSFLRYLPSTSSTKSKRSICRPTRVRYSCCESNPREEHIIASSLGSGSSNSGYYSKQGDGFAVFPHVSTAPYSRRSASTGTTHNSRGTDVRSNSHHSPAPTNYQPRTIDDFATRDSRLGFIRKVYAIFGTQMLTTIIITYFIMTNRGMANFFFRNFKALSLASFLGSAGIIMAMVNNPDLRHKAPANFMLLGVHTVLQSLMVGTFSSFVSPRAVCLGTMHTLFAFLAITLYSFQPNPKYDLTLLGNTLLSALTSLLVGSVLNIFFKLPVLDNLLSAGFAVIFAVYLSYDTQKIVGGQHRKHNFGQKEYILAALSLYQDVINLYIQIVSLLNDSEQKRAR